MAYTKYSLTPANNNAAPPDGAPEGMLPSAVNDTMRDMMAQIRDVGDGIRGGTYTMTAPVITGGSVSGATGSFSTLAASGVATFSAGTVSAPAITTTGDTNTGIFFPAADTIAFTEGGVESMRIDASGNVGIGISSPTEKLSVNGGLVVTGAYNGASNGGAINFSYASNAGSIHSLDPTVAWKSLDIGGSLLTFGTGGSERMRITSGGDLCVGDTVSNGAKLNLVQAADSLGQIIRCTNANYATHPLDLAVDRNTTNNSYYFIRAAVTGVAYRFQVADSGNVTNTNNSYGAISDIKLKENIVDATPKLDALCNVKVRNFNFIGSKDKQIGVIAQELETVFPSMVDVAPDKDMEGNDLGTTTKQVKYSVFVPMLIKAIQELKAELDSVKAELQTLKGN
jgi:hypothetical protein